MEVLEIDLQYMASQCVPTCKGIDYWANPKQQKLEIFLSSK